jgi:hypothetical protein
METLFTKLSFYVALFCDGQKATLCAKLETAHFPVQSHNKKSPWTRRSSACCVNHRAVLADAIFAQSATLIV